jgi:purine-binding chemotaxis protein CheW
MSNRTNTVSHREQYLTFSLGKEEYGIEILRVQEIKGYSAITPIPHTSRWIKGVMNLRGIVIPVIDLREKFSMEAVAYTKFTVIIVVNIQDKVTGLIVDAVSDVLEISAEDIVQPSGLGRGKDVSFIEGMAHLESDRLAVLINIDKLFSEEDMILPAEGRRETLMPELTAAN